MKQLIEHIMLYLAAVAYAESGEFDTVRSLMQECRLRKHDREAQRKRRSTRLWTSRSA